MNNARPPECRNNADLGVHGSIIIGIRQTAIWQQHSDLGRVQAFRLSKVPHSPATTTRSTRGFELSPCVRSSKIPVNAQPASELQMKTTISDGTRRRRCRKPGASPC